jgi:hypothetical protein
MMTRDIECASSGCSSLPASFPSEGRGAGHLDKDFDSFCQPFPGRLFGFVLPKFVPRQDWVRSAKSYINFASAREFSNRERAASNSDRKLAPAGCPTLVAVDRAGLADLVSYFRSISLQRCRINARAAAVFCTRRCEADVDLPTDLNSSDVQFADIHFIVVHIHEINHCGLLGTAFVRNGSERARE